jgi:DNA modification methylase
MQSPVGAQSRPLRRLEKDGFRIETRLVNRGPKRSNRPNSKIGRNTDLMALEGNQLYQGDCIERLAELDEGSIDLAFADPPFNIGYEYDVYHDRQPYEAYLAWTRQWMGGVSRALSPTGTFWVAIGDEYAAEIKLIAQNDLGLTCRSWVIWYYTFGVNCKRKFTRSHAHLFHFVKHPAEFTFNGDDPAVRVPSARQLVYADTRANPAGRLPDDTWILRPQDIPDGFGADQDTWYFARVAGTFKEREGFHGCQMPEQLLGRIIRASSHEGDLVLDPFAGSGTTLAVAKKLGRRWLGFELSTEYVTKVRERLDGIRPGQPLNGPENPLLSAPATPATNGARTPKARAARSQRPSSPANGQLPF